MTATTLTHTANVSYGADQLEHENTCRLCGGSLTALFSKTVLGKYAVTYFKCSGCLSLLTERPYWLDEAYQKSNLANADTGAAQRNLRNLAATYGISKLLKAKNVIDIGGGDGLLCRLLRDYQINCYLQDKYAIPTYAQGFTEHNFASPDLVLGFEVLEHYPNPIADLDNVFSYNPRAFLLSTCIYSDQNKDWWYLAPESGQHVFFYSNTAMEMIANKYQYGLVTCGDFILFFKNPSFLKKLGAKILLRKKVVRLLKAIIVLLPTPGISIDHALQTQKSEKRQA